MFTKLFVIQKIKNDGQVEVSQFTSEALNWTFEHRRIQTNNDKEYFPFSVNGKYHFVKRQAGAETGTIVGENEITFYDDYAIPGDSVIAILFPKNYIPDIIKFKDKPTLPVGLGGHVVSRPTGQIQIKYNHFVKQCSLIFNINETISFSFKCIAKKVNDDEFPNNEINYVDDLFDITLSREFLNVDAITTEDLMLINETLNPTEIADIQQTLNELLIAIKSGQKEESNKLLSKAGTLLLNVTSLASNLTTILDSYKTGGAAQQFVAKIIEHANL